MNKMRRISWLADLWSFSWLTLLNGAKLLAFHLNTYYIYCTYVPRQVEPSNADVICSTSWHNILRDSHKRNTTLATCFCCNWCHGKHKTQALPEQWMLLFTTVCSRSLEKSGFNFPQDKLVYLVKGINSVQSVLLYRHSCSFNLLATDFFSNFSTPCIQNVSNTENKQGSTMK